MLIARFIIVISDLSIILRPRSLRSRSWSHHHVEEPLPTKLSISMFPRVFNIILYNPRVLWYYTIQGYYYYTFQSKGIIIQPIISLTVWEVKSQSWKTMFLWLPFRHAWQKHIFLPFSKSQNKFLKEIQLRYKFSNLTKVQKLLFKQVAGVNERREE